MTQRQQIQTQQQPQQRQQHPAQAHPPQPPAQLARRAAPATPAVIDRPCTMAVSRALANDFHRDPVRRASDAAHGGATLTLVTGAKFGSSLQRRQTLTFSAGNWLLDRSEVISAGVAYHMLRACSQIDISRN